ncbi:Hsp20/alpha crystallin family protein [Zhongshania guokunii]|uniref:Hsp20/alpha crystallin family protein n=1 Tax=Zhongshania guokunii TaxID=641783 RepID=A0ABV3U4K2_9GAMM
MNSYLPFALFNEFRDANSAFERQHSDSERRAQWQPAVDVCENDGGFLLVMDVPGMAPDAVDISVHNGILTVQGERKIDTSEGKLSISERWQGTFVRRFTLPEGVEVEQIAAKLEHGVLALNIPKCTKEEPRKIRVQ